MNYHKKVIELLGNESANWREIVFKIAGKNPKAVADAMQTCDWHEAVKREYKLSGKLPAIKLCRKLSGIGLKEAKDAVEGLCES